MILYPTHVFKKFPSFHFQLIALLRKNPHIEKLN